MIADPCKIIKLWMLVQHKMVDGRAWRLRGVPDYGRPASEPGQAAAIFRICLAWIEKLALEKRKVRRLIEKCWLCPDYRKRMKACRGPKVAPEDWWHDDGVQGSQCHRLLFIIKWCEIALEPLNVAQGIYPVLLIWNRRGRTQHETFV